MKISTLGVITAATILLASCVNSPAIEGLQIAISGTNLVLSWPSQGYEHYLIQHRATLDGTDSWSELTNNYPANSAERTTYTIYGVVPPPPEGGGGGGGGGVPSPPGMSSLSMTDVGANHIVYPLDDATVTMLAKQHVFPPYEWDLQGREPFVWEREGRPPYPWDPGATRSEMLARPGLVSLDGAESDGGETDSGGSSDGMGFYRVFHIPDFYYDLNGEVFDQPLFFPVDFADYRDHLASIEVLLNGEPTPYARYMPYPISGVTYYGVAIFFDRLTNGVHSLGLRTTLNLNKTVGDDMPHLTLSNLPAMVTVSNVVNYPSWEDHVVGTNHVFRAQCAYPNVDWEITVYDVNYDLVNYASGTSTNGVIEWAWDLTDAWGNPRDNVDWDPVFLPEVTYAAGLPRQTNTSIMP